ncbi:RagB/SusD family nutrient uptake outer membrane protein [Sphingobacterium sp. SGG-5]|uniref:RagB/SusD family nutrient uptake outer membrane protein n=1 Tax=Sphingobacterium sp. SGG-5 TaxID=2710881 RepID=UPI0013ED33EB|nr:RagB/SusD family nutrient uptake outer membrane protein [Sphingobacterium sp. SGG-5]NGM63089.1 RagB/SusD family nutrient uptake outer membrane protein [Sphingobacterium sp. SGG-5]
MKRIFLGCCIWMMILLTVSCDLYLEDPNNMGEKNFWKTEQDALYGLAGVFSAYQVNALMGKKYREFDHVTDNAQTSQNQGWLDFELEAHHAQTGQVRNFWQNYYNVVHRANEVIRNVDIMPVEAISDESRKRIVAEAMFLKAYAYHDLTALWGDVPLYMEPIGPFDTPVGPMRQVDLVAHFVTELKADIIPNLPPLVPLSERGRIPRGAAQALLGKFYLLEDDYQHAADAFGDIIAEKIYTLHPDYGKLFTPDGEFSSESLFEINFEGDVFDQGESFSVQVDTLLAPRIPSNFWRPSRDLADSYLFVDGRPAISGTIYGDAHPQGSTNDRFKDRDPRLRATLYTREDVKSNGDVYWNINTNNMNTSFAAKKYSWISSQQYDYGGPQNYYVIRYADVLLMYAEAQNEVLGAPDQSIYDAVNAIRDRLDMPHYPEGLTQDEMRLRIQDERRWEFALEHQRFFDLKRWDILVEKVYPMYPPANTRKKYTRPKVYTWPYPLDEMDRNPGLKKHGQNDGYH